MEADLSGFDYYQFRRGTASGITPVLNGEIEFLLENRENSPNALIGRLEGELPRTFAHSPCLPSVGTAHALYR